LFVTWLPLLSDIESPSLWQKSALYNLKNVYLLRCNQGTVADLTSAVWRANYDTLDRCIADQIVIDAVASRAGKVDEFVVF